MEDRAHPVGITTNTSLAAAAQKSSKPKSGCGSLIDPFIAEAPEIHRDHRVILHGLSQ